MSSSYAVGDRVYIEKGAYCTLHSGTMISLIERLTEQFATVVNTEDKDGDLLVKNQDDFVFWVTPKCLRAAGGPIAPTFTKGSKVRIKPDATFGDEGVRFQRYAETAGEYYVIDPVLDGDGDIRVDKDPESRSGFWVNANFVEPVPEPKYYVFDADYDPYGDAPTAADLQNEAIDISAYVCVDSSFSVSSTKDYPPTSPYQRGDVDVDDVINSFELDSHVARAVRYILSAGLNEATDYNEDLALAREYLRREIDVESI